MMEVGDDEPAEVLGMIERALGDEKIKNDVEADEREA